MWVVDNNSDDGTHPYLETLNAPIHWISEPDKGVYHAMNTGISLANGDWIYFLGSDDQLNDSETLASVFDRKFNSEVAMIIGKIKYAFSKADTQFIKKNNGVFTSSWSKTIWFKNTLHHQSLFYKSTLFNQGTFDTSYAILADYHFNLQLFKSDIKTASIDEVIAVCATGGHSKNYSWKLYREEIRLKSAHSSKVLSPFFFIIALTKYILKNVNI